MDSLKHTWMGKYIVNFHPKHPKQDQNLQFKPLSKEGCPILTNIPDMFVSKITRTPVTFIWESHLREQGSKMDPNFPKVEGWNGPMDYQNHSKRTGN